MNMPNVSADLIEKAELLDFQCVLMTSVSLLDWWDSIPIRNEDPETPEQALDNIRALYAQAVSDGVYPLK